MRAYTFTCTFFGNHLRLMQNFIQNLIEKKDNSALPADISLLCQKALDIQMALKEFASISAFPHDHKITSEPRSSQI